MSFHFIGADSSMLQIAVARATVATHDTGVASDGGRALVVNEGRLWSKSALLHA
jgi:hypothetical protein